MKAFFYYIISRIPFNSIELLTKFLFPLVYNVLKYRRNVVRSNLSNAFPELEYNDLKKLEQQHYKYIIRLLLETFQLSKWTINTLKKHVYFDEASIKLLNKLYSSGKSIVIYTGHYGNWEWVVSYLGHVLNHKQMVIYKPIKDKTFESLINKNRSKFGTQMISMNDARESIMQEKGLFSVLVIGDQSPRGKNLYWTKFLNQDTCFFKSAFDIAKNRNLTQLYLKTDVSSQGHYKLSLQMINDSNQDKSSDKCLEEYVSLLEADIKKQPVYWLWTHKRWKHKR